MCTCSGEGFCVVCRDTDVIVYQSATGGEPRQFAPPSKHLIISQAYSEVVGAKPASFARCEFCGLPEVDMSTGIMARLWAHRACVERRAQ